MPRGNPGQPKGRYAGDFKQNVVEYMRENGLSYRETGRLFELRHDVVIAWERIYLEEGVAGLHEERRGRASTASDTQKGSKPKLDKAIEEDLIAENQRLRMEIDYLKKLNALVQERQHQTRKPKQSGN